MQIIDKHGYLDGALDYIDRYLVSGRGLQKIAKKARINEDLVNNLSSVLKNFSEKAFLAIVQEKIEDRHSSLPGADIEISLVDMSIEFENKVVYVLMNLICDIVVEDEKEDKIKLEIKIFSNNDIRIKLVS